MSAPVRLRRTMSRKDLVIFGLAILTPTAAYPVLGMVQQVSNGHAALSYLTAMVAMLFTAMSYGRMAAAYPVAGSSYSYARKALHPAVGFLAGWAMLLDYALIPLLSAVFVSLTAHRLWPGVPFGVWAFLFCAFITGANLRGMQLTKRANELMLLVMCVSALWFIAAAGRTAAAGPGLSMQALYNPATFGTGPLLLGAGIAALSYLGFDAISTLAEETEDPARDIGVATVLVCLIQTLLCFAIVYLGAVVWPASRPFPDAETAILDISRLTGGEALFQFNTAVLLVAGAASSLASVSGASRLLYGMGRDGVLPRRLFGQLDDRHATPVRAVALIGAFSFLGALVVPFQQVVELVNFGAFAGFVLVNLSVIAQFWIRGRERGGVAVMTNLLCPLAGALCSTWIWMSLSSDAKRVGFAWLAAGIVYAAVLTRGFSRPLPEMEMP